VLEKISGSLLLITGFISVMVSVFLIIVPYLLYPQFYIPKAVPSMGYIMPNTAEGWLILIAALALLTLGTVLLITYNIRVQNASKLPQVSMDKKF
jgi:hypothetical protein